MYIEAVTQLCSLKKYSVPKPTCFLLIHRVDPQTLAMQDVPPPRPPRANHTPDCGTLVEHHVQQNQEVAPVHAIQVPGANNHVETNNSRQQDPTVSAISLRSNGYICMDKSRATQER